MAGDKYIHNMQVWGGGGEVKADRYLCRCVCGYVGVNLLHPNVVRGDLFVPIHLLTLRYHLYFVFDAIGFRAPHQAARNKAHTRMANN